MTRLDRRGFLRAVAALGAGTLVPNLNWAAGDAKTQATSGAVQRVRMVRYPQKTDLILLTDRPPQLETPLKYFRTDLTPNDAFFVRWHLSGIPTSVDTRTFRLALGGHVNTPLALSIDQLKKEFEPVSMAAVAQCSGNSRSFFQPRVMGGQWGNGAVGNAKWTGVRLSELLKRAGVKEGAVDVSFAGLDKAPLPDTPNFVKSLELAHANDGEVMVAYAMNDAPLPMLNGFPLRLVVPGWFATYWVKALDRIEVLPKKFSGFWMDKAYRIATAPRGDETPQQLATETIPINRHTIRSFFVHHEIKDGEVSVEGVAFDGGDGITKVELSANDGQRWSEAALGNDMGKYAWRRWGASFKPDRPGKITILCRATNSKGETQPTAAGWNRSGYQRNVIERLEVVV
jgi:sulfite dehydrogenase (cytochrome) subunit A